MLLVYLKVSLGFTYKAAKARDSFATFSFSVKDA